MHDCISYNAKENREKLSNDLTLQNLIDKNYQTLRKAIIFLEVKSYAKHVVVIIHVTLMNA